MAASHGSKVACVCPNNSVGRFHTAGQTPCGLTAADTKARFWVVGIYDEHRRVPGTYGTRPTGRKYASLYASFNTVAGAQRRFRSPIPGPIDWADLNWAPDPATTSYQLVRNPKGA